MSSNQQLGTLHEGTQFIHSGTPYIKISSQTPTYDISGTAEIRNLHTDEVINLDNAEFVVVLKSTHK